MQYNDKPSRIMNITDPYTAYCFDQACTYIHKKMASGEKPQYVREYKSFSEMYKKYG